jgi:hypothetical protein
MAVPPKLIHYVSEFPSRFWSGTQYHPPRYFAGDGEVDRLARALPVDGRGDRTDPGRILGSLPVGDVSELPLPELRADLERVSAARSSGSTPGGS